MHRYLTRVTFCMVLVLAGSAVEVRGARAGRNQRLPGICYAYPAGGQQGTSFDVQIAGRYLDGISGVAVSGRGVSATLVKHVKPLNGKEINLLRDKLKELQEKVKTGGDGNRGGAADANDAAAEDVGEEIDIEAMKDEMAEIRKKLANPKNRNRENPQMGEDVTIRVTISPNAEAGRRELRLKAALGLSNPVVFHVGQMREYNEQEPNNRMADANAVGELPVIINGQIRPGDVDRFRLKLSKGDSPVMAVSARALIPYLADAVPGWFQATLALYDANGNELAYADDYRFNPDPVLFYEIGADGEYILEIKDAIYRGREDFVYRIAVGESPFITSIFPLGVSAGDKATVKLQGWNLPVDELEIGAKDVGFLPVSVVNNGLVSNTLAFAVDALAEEKEREPNNKHAFAQAVKAPLIVNGRIETPGDSDIFCFDARAGERIVAEVRARRLNSPLDSALKLIDEGGAVIAANDDCEDKACGLTTHHADSMLTAKIAKDGRYYLYLTDAQGKGGDAYAYRLRISPPMPDFELRAVPSSLSVRTGATGAITVYAIRKDGFEGEIGFSLVGAAEGFVLKGGPLKADQESVQLTLKAPSQPSRRPFKIRLRGSAQIDGRRVSREVVPADDMMQAFIYRHLVPAQDLAVAVLPRANRKPAAKQQNSSKKAGATNNAGK
ncbi:MAG: hypothetical protein JW720_03615 [Sedimentisphaerales bacterium]|nr:hypothetical protein [Sedimentisphaerales bacterium]